MRRKPKSIQEAVILAVGVVVAAVLVTLIRVAFVNYEIKKLTDSSQQSLARIKERATAQVAEQQRRRVEQLEAKAHALEEAKRQAELEQAAAQNLEWERQRAWAEYYQPSPECLKHTSVECGNQYIKARREFDRVFPAH